MIVKTDCIYYKGDIPCRPHKQFGYHCETCPEYRKIDQNIIIIKLGAIGDVIRTTPILRKIRQVYPYAFISWLTYSPDILSSNWVDRILGVNVENIELIKQIEFDWLIVLDKDPIAIALSKQILAKKKSGFTIDKFGKVKPISTKAEEHKWLTGIFDDLSRNNTKHYVQEMFEILDLDFNNEEYILDIDNNIEWKIDHSNKVIGLNTGCGGRWTSRLWADEYWVKLAKELLLLGYEVIFLGGKQEHEKNLILSEKSGAKYFGYFSLKDFISLVNECDLVVTAVTMAMHIAVGLKKMTIIFNSIFNKSEFYLYGRGEILEPDPKCDCYYKPVCPHDSMSRITPDKVLQLITKTLNN